MLMLTLELRGASGLGLRSKLGRLLGLRDLESRE